MTDLLKRAELVINQQRLLAPRQKLLVAVSGGADSMVLLHVLRNLASAHHWQMAVVHFNHRLRGRASDADEKFVRATASRLELPFHSDAADVQSFASRSGMSIEMAARKLRHEFLAGIARHENISTIALAHHANDQVELFFLRWLRGSGGTGLAGMPPCSPSPVDKKIALIRPLLGFTKPEILAFARAKKIRFREDTSNHSSLPLRNRIRNELIPLLEKKYQPALIASVLRTMEIIGAESALAASMARHWREHAGHSAREFSVLPLAIQRQVLQQQLIEQGVPVDFDLVESLRTTPKNWISVGASLSVARDSSGTVNLRRSGDVPSTTAFASDQLKIDLSAPSGSIEFSGRTFFWTRKKVFIPAGQLRLPSHQSRTEKFDADRVGAGIILRHWKAGDRYRPIGFDKPVKLQDVFVNAKIPPAFRRQVVVATTADGTIFWVEGLRIADTCKLTSETRRCLAWNWVS